MVALALKASGQNFYTYCEIKCKPSSEQKSSRPTITKLDSRLVRQIALQPNPFNLIIGFGRQGIG